MDGGLAAAALVSDTSCDNDMGKIHQELHKASPKSIRAVGEYMLRTVSSEGAGSVGALE